MSGAEFPRVVIRRRVVICFGEVGRGFSVRTRRRCYLVAFAAYASRRSAFIQFGNKMVWLRGHA